MYAVINWGKGTIISLLLYEHESYPVNCLLQVEEEETKTVPDGEGTKEITFTKTRSKLVILHCDIIGQKFWTDHPELLG